MAKLFANSEEPDQMPHSVASDLSLHCMLTTLLGVSRLKWVNRNAHIFICDHDYIQIICCFFVSYLHISFTTNCYGAKTLVKYPNGLASMELLCISKCRPIHFIFNLGHTH